MERQWTGTTASAGAYGKRLLSGATASVGAVAKSLLSGATGASNTALLSAAPLKQFVSIPTIVEAALLEYLFCSTRVLFPLMGFQIWTHTASCGLSQKIRLKKDAHGSLSLGATRQGMAC